MSREYGWALKGQKVMEEISGKRYARESFLTGLNEGLFIAPLCYKGACDTVWFNFWLANFLLPALTPGYILVMDNATFHKSEETRKLINTAGCRLLFLPPYPPDLNPIEKFWVHFKKKIKKVITQFSSLADAIDYVFRIDQLKFK